MQTEPLLETRGLSKRFGGVQAVSDVSLRLAPGELRCIIGPNGAGKRTLFKLLRNQRTPSPCMPAESARGEATCGRQSTR